MKKSTKVIISIAVVMVVLGASLSGLAWTLSGGNIGMSIFPGGEVSYGETPTGIGKDLKDGAVTPGAFDSVELNTDYGLVTFVQGEEFRVEYRLLKDLADPEISVDNGVLTIRNTPLLPNGKRLFNLSGNWLRQIGRADNDATITVIYPKGTEFAHIGITNDLGQVDLADLTLGGTLTLQSDMGDISLEGIAAKDMEIGADMGDLELRDIKTGRLSLEMDLGSVDGERVQADFLESSVAMGNLNLTEVELAGIEADTDMGAISLSGTLSGDIYATSSMGSVALATTLPRSDFYIDATSDMGSVKADGKKLGGDVGNSSAPNQIRASCDMGSIELYFGVSGKPAQR